MHRFGAQKYAVVWWRINRAAVATHTPALLAPPAEASATKAPKTGAAEAVVHDVVEDRAELNGEADLETVVERRSPLAKPEQNVIVCNGDGSTLMNLGSLVTITAEAPKNLTLLLFDNRVYEVTGSQTTPGSSDSRNDNRDVDFGSLAKACGFQSVFEFDTLPQWQETVREVIEATGPTCAWIKVAPIPNAGGPRSPSPGRKRAVEFAEALRECSASSEV